MNKAFVREPDSTVERCPRCGSPGQPVTRPTLDAMLTAEARPQISDTACFCPFPQCEVAYFDAFERFITVTSLVRPVYPKSQDAPICACFGFTRDDVDQDVAEGGVARCRALIEKSRSLEAHCSTAAANGQSCAPDVQRYYFKIKGGPE